MLGAGLSSFPGGSEPCGVGSLPYAIIMGKIFLRTDRYRRVYSAVTRTGYTFECYDGVCLAEVDERDLVELLRRTDCCGRGNRIIFEASPEEINRWMSARAAV